MVTISVRRMATPMTVSQDGLKALSIVPSGGRALTGTVRHYTPNPKALFAYTSEADPPGAVKFQLRSANRSVSPDWPGRFCQPLTSNRKNMIGTASPDPSRFFAQAIKGGRRDAGQISAVSDERPHLVA